MIVFPNAKINIGLYVTGKRPDGYHNIISCFYPIPWTDVLEVIEGQHVQFETSGISIPGNPDDNLCLKAYHLLQRDFHVPPVNIHLHKVIPVGAGLGGGSADGAFMLKALNQLFDLQIDNDRLEDYASKLGSDCPFFIQNKPVIASQTGNVFEAIDLDLRNKFLVLVYPEIHVSTSEAYSGLKGYDASIDLSQFLGPESIANWPENLTNKFEESIFEKYPEISQIKDTLYDHGAIYASMTGSGATVFGIFERSKALKHVFPAHYTILETIL